jgi:hypothetical protein
VKQRNNQSITEKGSIITTVSEHDQSHRENIADDVHQPSEDCRYVNDSQTNDRGYLKKRTTILQTNGQLEYYPGISTERPKHPYYGIKSVRLSSFTNWNQGIVDPTQLAEAGFFYTGIYLFIKVYVFHTNFFLADFQEKVTVIPKII